VFLPRLAPWILQPHPRPSPRSDCSSRCPWLISARGFSQSTLVLYLCCLNRSGPSSWCRFSSCSPEVFVQLGLGTCNRSEGCVFFMCLVLRLLPNQISFDLSPVLASGYIGRSGSRSRFVCTEESRSCCQAFVLFVIRLIVRGHRQLCVPLRLHISVLLYLFRFSRSVYIFRFSFTYFGFPASFTYFGSPLPISVFPFLGLLVPVSMSRERRTSGSVSTSV
jgi:hypothetical protein